MTNIPGKEVKYTPEDPCEEAFMFGLFVGRELTKAFVLTAGLTRPECKDEVASISMADLLVFTTNELEKMKAKSPKQPFYQYFKDFVQAASAAAKNVAEA